MEFLNSLKKKFDTVSQSVGEKARDSIELTKLNSELRTAKSNLEKQYAAFGRACYKLKTGKGDEAPVESAFARLEGLIAEVEKLTAQVDALKAVGRCPVCGAEVAQDALFCSKCGTKLSGEQKPAFTDDADNSGYIRPSEWKLPDDESAREEPDTDTEN